MKNMKMKLSVLAALAMVGGSAIASEQVAKLDAQVAESNEAYDTALSNIDRAFENIKTLQPSPAVDNYKKGLEEAKQFVLDHAGERDEVNEAQAAAKGNSGNQALQEKYKMKAKKAVDKMRREHKRLNDKLFRLQNKADGEAIFVENPEWIS